MEFLQIIHANIIQRQFFLLYNLRCRGFQIFRRLMKGNFDAYVLWPLTKKFQNWIVDWSTARDFTVVIDSMGTFFIIKMSLKPNSLPNMNNIFVAFESSQVGEQFEKLKKKKKVSVMMQNLDLSFGSWKQNLVWVIH